MAQHEEIIVWLDRRWKEAIEHHLKDETLQEHLENVLDELCNQLPEREYARISREIWEEDRMAREKAEAARTYSAYRVVEGGEEHYFRMTPGEELLDAARTLRKYLKDTGHSTGKFISLYLQAQPITPEEYQNLMRLRMENTGKVTGVFDLDFDKREFSAVHIMDGWTTWAMRDVSTAAYRAVQKQYASEDGMWRKLLDHLNGKELTSAGHLTAQNFSFSDEIMIENGKLNFYVQADFDVDAAFGTFVCTDENDDWLNIYANYDLERDAVCDTLELNLCKGDGSEENWSYHLNAAEQEVLARKMEAFCQQQNGMSLHRLFEELKDIRQDVEIPLILMGYLNPIFHYGFEAFCQSCADCGIDGVIIPDLPFRDYMETFKPIADRHGLKIIMLITPETSKERIRLIDRHTDGFIYMVSSAATTGAQKEFDRTKQAYFDRVNQMGLTHPRMIGFGISNRQTLESAQKHAAGAIIGSRFVALLDQYGSATEALDHLREELKK